MASSVAAVAEKALATIRAAFNALDAPDGSGMSQLVARTPKLWARVHACRSKHGQRRALFACSLRRKPGAYHSRLRVPYRACLVRQADGKVQRPSPTQALQAKALLQPRGKSARTWRSALLCGAWAALVPARRLRCWRHYAPACRHLPHSAAVWRPAAAPLCGCASISVCANQLSCFQRRICPYMWQGSAVQCSTVAATGEAFLHVLSCT